MNLSNSIFTTGPIRPLIDAQACVSPGGCTGSDDPFDPNGPDLPDPGEDIPVCGVGSKALGLVCGIVAKMVLS